ncbi:MAG: hypothetical protein ABIC82_05280 [bacterium]
MNDSRWENLTKMIESKFDVEEDYIEEIPQSEGGGKIDVIICNAGAGKIKLERYVRPLVLDKKTFYSKRGGSDTAVEYVYSEDETTQSLKLYKWDEFNEVWREISSNNISDIIG